MGRAEPSEEWRPSLGRLQSVWGAIGKCAFVLLSWSWGREGVERGAGGWVSAVYPACCRLLPCVVLPTDTVYNFPFIISARPSGPKSYRWTVIHLTLEGGHYHRSEVSLLGTDEIWSKERDVWASKRCLIFKAGRNGISFVFWTPCWDFFPHLLRRDY